MSACEASGGGGGYSHPPTEGDMPLSPIHLYPPPLPFPVSLSRSHTESPPPPRLLGSPTGCPPPAVSLNPPPLHPSPPPTTVDNPPPLHEWRIPPSKGAHVRTPRKYQAAYALSLDGAPPPPPPPCVPVLAGPGAATGAGAVGVGGRGAGDVAWGRPEGCRPSCTPPPEGGRPVVGHGRAVVRLRLPRCARGCPVFGKAEEQVGSGTNGRGPKLDAPPLGLQWSVCWGVCKGAGHA